MLTFDEVAAMLDEIADALPLALSNDLNGGVYLLPETKMHPESNKQRPLYVLGEYIRHSDLGKYIFIYYGSIMKVHSHLPPAGLKQALKNVLLHEYTHHVEFLAGERGLEIKDQTDLNQYLHDK